MKSILTLLTLLYFTSFGYSQCITDTIPPIASCQNTPLYLSNSGIATLSPIQIDNGSSDNCAITSMLLNGQDSLFFSCANIGTNAVVLSVIDSFGNTSSCVSNITIIDTIAPIASCQNTTLYLSNSGIATLSPTQIDNGSFDNCGIVTMSVNGLPSETFNCTNAGLNTPVLLEITDVYGNTSVCLSTVTVIDTIAPIASCHNISLSSLSSSGVVILTPSQIDNGSSDNCGIATMLVNGSPSEIFNCTNAGLNTPVLLEITDLYGNTSSCLSTVTVIDSTAPIASCQNTSLNLSNNGVAILPPSQIDNGSSDNCAIATMFVNSDTFDCSDVGINSVLLTVTDIYGNVANCASTVTITDSLSLCALSHSTIHQIEENIHIYPNPTAQILNIDSKEGLLQQITLTNITGQIVLTQNEAGSKQTTQLDLSTLPNAVYLITVITNKGISTQKIILQH